MLAGWQGQLDVALATRNRVVLAGNVQDRVLDAGSGEALPFVDWLWRSLASRGYGRIVAYDLDGPPRVLRWCERRSGDLVAVEDSQAVEDRLRAAAAPLDGLHLLQELLREDVATAVIVTNSERRIDTPSPEAVALQAISQGNREGTAIDSPRRLRNLAVLIYCAERDVPAAVLSDPESAVIAVQLPSFAERRAVLDRAWRATDSETLFQMDAGEVARQLEGYRVAEIEHVVRLQRAGVASPAGSSPSLPGLLTMYRSGERIDHWSNAEVSQIGAELGQRVRGQSEALDRIVDMLYEAKLRLGELPDAANRGPRLVLFFVGPTGVGKTLCARSLAEAVTGNAENFKRFDLSEYKQEHDAQRLTGPPPGYVGHEQGGQLTEFVRLRPHSVILLDEFEKGHPLTFDKFLQVLDAGRMTDGRGVTVDFSDTCIIFTSNVGTREGIAARINAASYPDVRAFFEREVERFFVATINRPELFGRLSSGIVAFNYITPEMFRAEAERHLTLIETTVAARWKRAIRFDRPGVTDGLLERLDPAYGLRGLNQVIKRHLLPALGRHICETSGGGTTGFTWDPSSQRVRGRAC